MGIRREMVIALVWKSKMDFSEHGREQVGKKLSGHIFRTGDGGTTPFWIRIRPFPKFMKDRRGLLLS